MQRDNPLMESGTPAFNLRPTLMSVAVGMPRLIHDENQRRLQMRNQVEAMLLHKAQKEAEEGQDKQF